MAGRSIAVSPEDVRLALGRDSMVGFLYYTYPQYMMGWVHEEICKELDAFLHAVIERRSPRLMLTMPPRHGKSELASRRFPAYALGRYPDLSFIASSYSGALASRMNRDVQRIIDDPLYRRLFPGTTLSGMDAARKEGTTRYLRAGNIFEIVGRKGVYRAAGVGGGITGMGADIICCDDPVKDREAADSPTISQRIWDWYTSTLYTRLSPGGGIIIIQTRWADTDLSGRLLEAQARGEGDSWRVVNFPAIATQDEAHRRKGEALHPDRYPLESLERIKLAVGIRDWEALYQQHPIPEGGAIFREDWLRRTWLPKDLPSRFDLVVQSWDMTFKDGSASDYVVGQIWGKKGADFYLLDQVRGRWSFTESVDMVRNLTSRASRFEKGATRKYIEDAANGPAVIDMLKHEIPGIIPVKPDGTKVARAHAVTALFEAGNVVLPDSSVAPWVFDYKLELARFPNAAHDDQVDATTQALRQLSSGATLNIAPQIRRQVGMARRVF